MKLYKNVISVLFFALSVYVLILNVFCTCYTSADRFELNYYSGDIVILNIAAIAFFVAAAAFAGKARMSSFIGKHFAVIKAVLLILIAALGAVFVFSCGLGAGVDQLYVQRSVDELRNGSNASYQPLMYMEVHSNQFSFALISYLMSFVTGTYNYMAFRLMNVLFLVLLYNELSLIGKRMGLGRTGQILILLLGVFFLPTTLYTLFIYGNLAGVALSALAVRLMIDAFDKKKMIFGFLSCLAMFAACIFKTNYMIFVIGIGIYCFFKALSSKQFRNLIFVVLLAVSLWLSSFIPHTVLKNLTGLPLDNGMSYMSYVAMGLQDNSQNYAGGFNGFNEDSYMAVNGDSKAHTEYSADVTRQILAAMSEDPAYILNFFTRKQLHQWADPVYKAYWSSQAVPQYDTADWFYHFLRPDYEYPVTVAFSFFQLWAWLGAILFIWLGRKNEHFEEALIMPLIFIGGFIFHTFWEAKSQYVFAFFVILFPVAVMGWREFSKWFPIRDRTPIKEKIAVLSKGTISWSFSFTLVAVAVLFVFAEVISLATLREQFSQDRDLYKEYRTSGYRQSWNPLDDGKYKISLGDLSYEFEAINKGDKTRLREVNGGKYLTAAIVDEGKGTLTWQDAAGSPEQTFKLYMTDEGRLIIVYNDEYVYGGGDDVLDVYMVPYGTLDWSQTEDSMTWEVSGIGE